MGEKSHTPGEWVFGRREGWRVDAPTHFSSHYTLVAKGRRAPIAFVVSTSRDEDEYHANAHLIAAAPDLLEAGEPLAALVEYFTGDDDAEITVTAGELRRLRAAIAKAKGSDQ